MCTNGYTFYKCKKRPEFSSGDKCVIPQSLLTAGHLRLKSMKIQDVHVKKIEVEKRQGECVLLSTQIIT